MMLCVNQQLIKLLHRCQKICWTIGTMFFPSNFEGEIPNMLIAVVSLRFPLRIRAGYELAASYTQKGQWDFEPS